MLMVIKNFGLENFINKFIDGLSPKMKIRA